MADPKALMREVFGLFDRDGDGSINAVDVRVAVRATGANPSDAELDKALAGRENEDFDLAKFESFCGPFLQGRDVVAEMKKAFKPFDRDGSGKLSAGELKHVMRNLKAILSDEEIDKLIADADPSGTGSIHYEKLIDILIA